MSDLTRNITKENHINILISIYNRIINILNPTSTSGLSIAISTYDLEREIKNYINIIKDLKSKAYTYGIKDTILEQLIYIYITINELQQSKQQEILTGIINKDTPRLDSEISPYIIDKLLFYLGKQYSAYKDYTLAIYTFELIQDKSFIDYISIEKARIYLRLGQSKRAMELIDCTLKNPTSDNLAIFFIEKANILYNLNQIKETKKYIQKSYEFLQSAMFINNRKNYKRYFETLIQTIETDLKLCICLYYRNYNFEELLKELNRIKQNLSHYKLEWNSISLSIMAPLEQIFLTLDDGAHKDEFYELTNRQINNEIPEEAGYFYAQQKNYSQTYAIDHVTERHTNDFKGYDIEDIFNIILNFIETHDISKYEFRMLTWSADYLIPTDELNLPEEIGERCPIIKMATLLGNPSQIITFYPLQRIDQRDCKISLLNKNQ